MARQPAKPWTGECQRCAKKPSSHTMSIFNTDLLCLKCRDAELLLPNADKAWVALELAAHHGNYDFPGIGLPPIQTEPKEGNIWED